MSEITVYSPLGVNRVEAQAIADRIPQLKGLTIGILNNSKTNSLMLQEEVARLLDERFQIGGVIKNIKPNAALGAEGLEAFSKEVQAVITAIGD